MHPTDSSQPSAASASPDRSRVAILAVVLACVLWGTTGTVASFLPESVSPLLIGATTMTFGGLLLFVTAPRSSLSVVTDPAVRRWLIVGVIGVVIYPLAFYTAMDEAGVAVGNVVALGSGPVFAGLIELFALRQRPGRRWLVSTGIAVVGIALLSMGKAPDASHSGDIPLGVVLGLLAGLAYAAYTFASTQVLAGGHSSRAAMGGMFGLGAVVLAPIVVVLGASLFESAATLAGAAYLAVGPMFVAYLLFGFGLRFLASSSATTITLLEPVVATVLAILVVGERLAPIGWVGFFLILAGVSVLVTARQTRKPR